MINIKELNGLQKFKLEEVEKDYNNSYGNYHLSKYKEIAKLLLLPDNYFKTVAETLLNTKINDSSLYIYKDYLVEFGHLPTDKNLNNYFGKRIKQGDLLLNINYFYFLLKPEYYATIEFENLESCDETCIKTALKKHKIIESSSPILIPDEFNDFLVETIDDELNEVNRFLLYNILTLISYKSSKALELNDDTLNKYINCDGYWDYKKLKEIKRNYL